MARKLIPEGIWRLATDWDEYAHWIRDELDNHPELSNLHDNWAPRYAARPISKFERRGLEAGREVFDLAYRRRQ